MTNSNNKEEVKASNDIPQIEINPIPVDFKAQETRKRMLAIKDEEMTSFEWIEIGNYEEAIYFLNRLYSEVVKLRMHLESYA